jgi:hypothetical protein
MVRLLAAASAGLALVLLSGCSAESPEQKMMGACMRMNTGADVKSNCSCIVSRLKEKLTDQELSALADQVNEIFDRAGDSGDAAGMELGRRIKDRELVNQKVGDEFIAASKACPAAASPPAGTTAP